MYWIITAVIPFMILWRIGVNIVSSRYAAFMILVCIPAAVYGCFSLGRLCSAKKRFAAVASYVPWILIILLALSCIVKTLRYNPYHDHIIKACDVISKDVANYKSGSVLCQNDEVHRLAYYSKLPSGSLGDVEEIKSRNSLLSKIMKTMAEPGDVIYMVLFESSAEKPLSAVQHLPAWMKRHIKFMDEFYQNKNKKRFTRVYRLNKNSILEELKFSISPEMKRISSSKAVYAVNIKNPLPEGHGFYRETENYFKNKSLLQQPVLKDFPAAWGVKETPGYSKGSNAELGIVTLPEKQKVFRLKSDKRVTVFSPLYPAKKWMIRVKFSVSDPETFWGMSMHCYGAKGFLNFYSLPAIKVAESNKIFEYSLVLPDEFLEKQIRYISLVVDMQYGEIFIHSIELVKA